MTFRTAKSHHSLLLAWWSYINTIPQRRQLSTQHSLFLLRPVKHSCIITCNKDIPLSIDRVFRQHLPWWTKTMGLPAFLLTVRSNSRKKLLIKSKSLNFHTLACPLPSWRGYKPLQSHRPMLLTKTSWAVVSVKCWFSFSLKSVRETPRTNSPG